MFVFDFGWKKISESLKYSLLVFAYIVSIYIYNFSFVLDIIYFYISDISFCFWNPFCDSDNIVFSLAPFVKIDCLF